MSWEQCRIEIIEGLQGHGKTTFAVEEILKHLGRGGAYYGNVKLVPPAVQLLVWKRYRREVDPGQINYLTPEKLSEFYKHTPDGTREMPVLVVVDEIHESFNARKWAEADEQQLSYFTHVRKRLNRLLVISQHKKNIDSQLARVVEWTWTCVDIQRLRGGWRLFCWWVPGYIRILKFRNDREITRWTFHLKDRHVWECYETDQKHDSLARLQADVDFRGKSVHVTRESFRSTLTIAAWVIAGFLFAGYVVRQQLTKEVRNVEERVARLVERPGVEAPGGSGTPGKPGAGAVHVGIDGTRETPADDKGMVWAQVRPGWYRTTFHGSGRRGSRGFALTGMGEFWSGETCQWGKVMRIERDRVLIKGFDGRPIVVENFRVIHAERRGDLGAQVLAAQRFLATRK